MKKYIYKFLPTFLYGILAGIAIALGSFVFIYCAYYGNKILGSILFSVGLFVVCVLGLKLYTGQIAKLININEKPCIKPSFICELIIMLIGNLLGAFIIGYMGYCMKGTEEFNSLVKSIGDSKLYNFTSVTAFFGDAFKSLLCGALVFLGVEIFNKNKDKPLIGTTGLVLAVTTFVVCGFTHCIANMFYYTIAGTLFNNFASTVGSLALCILFNSIGAIIISLILDCGKVISKKQ